MNKLIVTLATLATIAAASAAAQAGYRAAPSTSLTLKPSIGVTRLLILKCQAQGSPVEFPNDIVIRNGGASTVPAGTKVKWQMLGLNSSGVVTLPALGPGQQHFISNANPGGLEAGHPCTVKKI
ncbi:MAG TPA: hypothetical protein PKE65_07475 [Rhizobiaceae bacterium]|nr:hypothetical protein [Rhizobiaceae bacterium]